MLNVTYKPVCSFERTKDNDAKRHAFIAAKTKAHMKEVVSRIKLLPL